MSSHEETKSTAEVKKMIGLGSSLWQNVVENGITLVYYDIDDKSDECDGIEYKGDLKDIKYVGSVDISSCNGPVTHVDGRVYHTKGGQDVKIRGLDVYIDDVLQPKE